MTGRANRISIVTKGLIGAAVFIGLYYIHFYNFLLYHTLAECFGIIIACSVFILVWNTRQYARNDFLLLLGIAYLCVGGIDLLHMLAYKGMGVFKSSDANLPTQLWIMARYVESCSLLTVAVIRKQKLNPKIIAASYACGIAILLSTVFYWDVFPACFIEGQGLTTFKVVSEYVISFILLCSMAFLYKKRKELDPGILQWLSLAILFSIGSELLFTFYISVFDLSNVLAHMLKIISFYFIYKAIIETGLRNPYALLFHELEQREKFLKGSEQRFKLSIDHFPGIFIIYDDRRRIQFINKNGLKLVPKSEKEIIGRTDDDAIPPEVRAPYMPLLNRAAETRKLQSEECVIHTPDGPRSFAVSYLPILDESGGLKQIIGVMQDVTLLKQKEAEIRRLAEESNNRRLFLRKLIDAVPVGIVQIKLPEYRIEMINPFFYTIINRTDTEVRDESKQIEFSDPLFSQIKSWVDKVYRTKQSKRIDEYEMASDSRTRTQYLEVTLIPVTEAGIVESVLVIVIDVTEMVLKRKQVSSNAKEKLEKVDQKITIAHKAKRRAEQRFYQFMQYFPGMAFVKDREGSILYVNEHAEHIFDRSNEDLIGTSYYDLWPEAVAEKQKSDDRQVAESEESLQTTTMVEHRGNSIAYLTYNFPIVQETEPTLIGVLLVDITRRIEAESQLQVYTQKLEWSNRDLEEFAFVASHDLQEPLRKIEAFSDRLTVKASDVLDEKAREYLIRMQRAVKRMRALITSLLAYSRVSSENEPFQRVELEKTVMNVLNDFSDQIKEKEADIHIGWLPTVQADPVQMEHLFINLIGNALKFQGSDKPIIHIHGKVGEDDIMPVGDGGKTCAIYVEDNGIGFDPANAANIFSPFNRLHGRSQYEGTGIGLSICRKIVERHGGTITAESVPQQGSTFIITLPMSPQYGGEKNGSKQ